MHSEPLVEVSLAVVGMCVSWAAWVTVMIFELREKIKLMKQEIEVLQEVKEVLKDIRANLIKKGHHG